MSTPVELDLPSMVEPLMVGLPANAQNHRFPMEKPTSTKTEGTFDQAGTQRPNRFTLVVTTTGNLSPALVVLSDQTGALARRQDSLPP